MYTPLEEAAALIKTRWADQNLRKAVADALQGDVPDILNDGPSGVLWRQIGTPDGECARFLERARLVGVKPLCLEYVEDKFTNRNFTKFGLGKLHFITGVNKNAQPIVVKTRIIQFQDAEGKRLCDVRTLWGEGLVEFHHVFLRTLYPTLQGRVSDLSRWNRKQGPEPRRYYVSFMSLAICHMVLFDDLDLLESETSFINEIVHPAFEEARTRFGLKPLVVGISNPGEHQQTPCWWYYSKAAKEFVDEHVKQFRRAL